MTSGIPGLIASLKGRRSYHQLAKDCGGAPTGARIQQMATGHLSVFPSPESIRGLAVGLGIQPGVVVQACAVTLGLMEGDDASDPMLLPDVAARLTEDQRHLVVSLVRELAAANGPQDGSGAADAA